MLRLRAPASRGCRFQGPQIQIILYIRYVYFEYLLLAPVLICIGKSTSYAPHNTQRCGISLTWLAMPPCRFGKATSVAPHLSTTTSHMTQPPSLSSHSWNLVSSQLSSFPTQPPAVSLSTVPAMELVAFPESPVDPDAAAVPREFIDCISSKTPDILRDPRKRLNANE
jgi:hypothetical protein